MEIKIEKIKPSRVKFIITAHAQDLAHAAEHAFDYTTKNTVVKGFRPGKAPRPMLVQAVSQGRILSELVDHALPEFLSQVAKEKAITIIETPNYTLEKLCELNPDGTLKEESVLTFTAEADYAPEVTVGDYHKIKIKPEPIKKVTDAIVDEVLHQLADRQTDFVKVDRPAQKGDRVTIDFAGKRGGIPEDRLASKNYPVVLGNNAMIPGFEAELEGKKAGTTYSFAITFPKDYHAKDLAGEKVVFDITVHEVAEKKLPIIDDTFAAQFGHKKIDELKIAIRKERELFFANSAKQKDEEAILEAFLPLVAVEIPKSLIDRELDRQIDTMRHEVEHVGATFDKYLEHLKKTEEELRESLRESAAKAVTIGLGLGEVVKKEELTKKENPGLAAIEKLVEIATKGAKQAGK